MRHDDVTHVHSSIFKRLQERNKKKERKSVTFLVGILNFEFDWKIITMNNFIIFFLFLFFFFVQLFTVVATSDKSQQPTTPTNYDRERSRRLSLLWKLAKVNSSVVSMVKRKLLVKKCQNCFYVSR